MLPRHMEMHYARWPDGSISLGSADRVGRLADEGKIGFLLHAGLQIKGRRRRKGCIVSSVNCLPSRSTVEFFELEQITLDALKVDIRKNVQLSPAVFSLT